MKITIEKLNEFFSNQLPVTSLRLKNYLFSFNLKERKCEKCSCSEWNGFPMPLELHHVDGNHYNNSFENLQIICPNCHSLEPSFTSSSKVKRKLTVPQITEAIQTSLNIREACSKLGLQGKGGNYATIKNYMSKYNLTLLPAPEIDYDESLETTIKNKKPRKKYRKYATYEESLQAITKGSYPTNERLVELVWEKSMLKLSKEIGVSDNGVRHYCQKRNIPVPPPGYWRKLETGKTIECEEIKAKAFLNWEGIKEINPFNLNKPDKIAARGFEPPTLPS